LGSTSNGNNVNAVTLFYNEGIKARLLSSEQPQDNFEAFDANTARRVCDVLAQNNTHLCPQLLLIEDLVTAPDDADNPLRQYVPQAVPDGWEKPGLFTPLEPSHVNKEKREVAKRYFERALEFVGIACETGVPILAGTHSILPYVYPGFDLHHELALLVQAGLSPLKALQSATYGAAKYLGRDELGKVAIGGIADLVILNANPLEDICNTKEIHTVVIKGKIIEKKHHR
jgi:hypothetical protein